jgi:hypothetical protein
MLAFGSSTLKGSYCHEIVGRLKSRRLLKQLFDEAVSQLPESCQEIVRDIIKPKHRELRRSLEQKIATVIQDNGIPLKCECKDPIQPRDRKFVHVEIRASAVSGR